MATSVIKRQVPPIIHSISSSQTTAEIWYTHNNYVCTFAAHITKTDPGWDIFTHIPNPKNLTKWKLGEINGFPWVIMTAGGNGVMQIQTTGTGTFTDAIDITGCYLTEDESS